MPVEQTKSNALDLSVDFSKEIKGQTRKDLESLKDQLAKDLAGDLSRLVVLCRNNKIKYREWTNGDMDAKKVEQIRSVLGQTASGEKLCKALESSDANQRKGAEQILGKITDLMEDQESKVQEFKSEKEELSKDVVAETLGDVTTSLKKTLARHPWQTIAALAVAGYALNYFWNYEGKVGQAVRGGIGLAAVGWAANFFTGAFTGKSGVQRLVDACREDGDLGEHMNDFLDNFEDDDRVDAGTLRSAFDLGSIPFNVFLQQYSNSKSEGKDGIDMKALKRRAGSLGIDSEAFDEKHGGELFALIEHIVDNAKYKGKTGMAALKAKYGDEVDGDKPFTFWQVIMIEELEDPEGIRPKEDDDEEASSEAEASAGGSSKKNSKKRGALSATAGAGAAGAGAAGAGAAGAEAAREKGYETYEEELLSILPFQNSKLVLEKPTSNNETTGISSGKGKLMGFDLQYERREDDEGNVQYKLTVEGATQAITLGESFDSAKQVDKANALKDHLRAKMQGRILATPRLAGVNEKAVDWKEERWVLPVKSSPTAPFLKTRPPLLQLEVRANSGNSVDVYLHGDRLESTEKIQNFVDRGATAEIVRREVGAFHDIREEDLEIQSIQVPTDPTKPTLIRGSVVGGNLEMEWRPSDRTFHVVRFELSPVFIDRKVEAAQGNARLKTIFDEMSKQGRSLSTWMRGAIDVINTQMPDREDYEWNGLVDFKRDELFRLYQGRLRDISPTDPEILTKVQEAYDATIGAAIRKFDSYPGKLGQAAMNGDDEGRDRMQHEILVHGWSPSYEQGYNDFLALVGPTNINLPGWNEASNKPQYEVLGYITGQWSRLTASVAHQEFPPHEGNVYHDYLMHVQGKIAAIVNQTLTSPTEETTRGYIWQQFVKDGVSLTELKAHEGEFAAIESWETYKANYLRDPSTESFIDAQRPELRGQAGDWTMEPVPGNPNQFKIRWYPGTAAEFEVIMEVNPSTKVLECLTLELSETWIDHHVDSIAAAPEFNKPFDDLTKHFVGIEVRANGYFPDAWEYFNGIEGGAWHSMATFKRQELLDSYRASLKGLLNQGLSPTSTAQAFNAQYRSFTDRYMKDVHALNARMAAEIQSFTTDDTPYLTEQEFSGFMRSLDFLGYGERYVALMGEARRTLEAFPYTGFDHPTDGVNRLLLLVNKKTSFMNRTTPKPEEEAYFKAVLDSAKQIAQRAYANQVGTGNFARASIGPEEIPDTLPIENYAQWLPLHPNAGKSALPPASNAPQTGPQETEGAKFKKRLNGIYNEHWEKKVYDAHGKILEGIDDENVDELQPKIDSQRTDIFTEIMLEPSAEKREKLIEAYTRYLDECFDQAEAGWWEFWE